LLWQLYRNERNSLDETSSVYVLTVGRLLWLWIGLIPFLFSVEAGLFFLIIALLSHSILAAIASTGWGSWIRDLVSQYRLGSFFSRRMALATALGIPLSLGAGFYIDYWKRLFPAYELYGYSILFFLGCLAGIVGVYYISTIGVSLLISLQNVNSPGLFDG